MVTRKHYDQSFSSRIRKPFPCMTFSPLMSPVHRFAGSTMKVLPAITPAARFAGSWARLALSCTGVSAACMDDSRRSRLRQSLPSTGRAGDFAASPTARRSTAPWCLPAIGISAPIAVAVIRARPSRWSMSHRVRVAAAPSGKTWSRPVGPAISARATARPSRQACPFSMCPMCPIAMRLSFSPIDASSPTR